VRPAVVLVATLAVTVAGCSGSGKFQADNCATVSAELVDIPSRTDQEPKMRIPLPQGWERSAKSDNETIRFAIRNPGLAVEDFLPNAVVTLQKLGTDIGKPQQIIEAQNEQLTKKLKLTDTSTASTEICGAPAETFSYVAPEIDLSKNRLLPKDAKTKIPPRTARSLSTVYKTGDSNYLATLTVQTVKPDDPTYIKDSDLIVQGFQVLSPK